ncbi:MAG: hypothetical protein ABIL58_20345 [Pseudomonadota bacterium]
MLKANWPYVLIAGLLVVYFRTAHPQPVWPEKVIVWAWLPYVVHVVLHNFVDGFQNTTRNIARITLIRTSGKDYDHRRVSPVQLALVPSFMTPVTLAWFAAHIGSFAVLLYFQGWGTALGAEIALILLGWVFPIQYAFHLKHICRLTDDADFTNNSLLREADVSPDAVRAVVAKAVAEKRNPQEWWATLAHGR